MGGIGANVGIGFGCVCVDVVLCDKVGFDGVGVAIVLCIVDDPGGVGAAVVFRAGMNGGVWVGTNFREGVGDIFGCIGPDVVLCAGAGGCFAGIFADAGTIFCGAVGVGSGVGDGFALTCPDVGTILCWGVTLGVGVGVGDCDDDLGRLYLIWLNAIEATNNDATIETMIRVIIELPVLNFNL